MRNILFFTFIFMSFSVQSQEAYHSEVISARGEKWVDSLIRVMTIDQKIGQLMMIRAHSDKGEKFEKSVATLIKKYHIGGLCFFQGTPLHQLELTNTYQSISQIPLLVGMDAEWGLGMRHKEDAQSFPYQLMLGALRNNYLIYQMGREIGTQLSSIGVHVNFAPVADVNNNIKNPVINFRSFGDDKKEVAQKSIQYMKGLQDKGLIACGKHFPGHGDTDKDSHHDLPIIRHSRERLDSIELYPFRELIHNGVGALMIAHLNVPALDSTRHKPTTLSQAVVTDLLQEELEFNGLIFTDAMEMKAVTMHYPNGEAEAQAIIAGNDILCLPSNVSAAFTSIKNKIKDGSITEERINHSVRKILRAKYKLGLSSYTPLSAKNLERTIFSNKGVAIIRNITENAITVVRDAEKVIPVHSIDGKRFASLAIGKKNITPFQNRLNSYTRIFNYVSEKHPTKDKMKDIIEQLSEFDQVFVSFHDMSYSAENKFGITDRSIALVKKLSTKTQVVVVLFGTPYAVKMFDELKSVVVAYNEDEITQDITAQGLFGAISFQGKLPVTASEKAKAGQGVITSHLFRLGWGVAEQVEMNSDTLAQIDDIAKEMITSGATPSCQILIAKSGKIVYHKAFGNKTYDKRQSVLINDLYDLASVTKVASTTLAVMNLYDKGIIDINGELEDYYSYSSLYRKGKMRIRDIMSHTAGLKAWIPFYKETLDEDGKPSSLYYRSFKESGFTIHVAKNLYLKDDYLEVMLEEIMESPMSLPGKYVYSDLGMLLLARMVEEIDGRPIDQYNREVFYEKLGLNSLMFNAHKYITSGSVVPSELDDYFRYQELNGYVHDMAAAMMGGVAGNAGLFGNSHDIAVIFQMLLNGGYYGGRRFLKQETVNYFTQRVPQSTRRGIGFDMKQLDESAYDNMSPLASRHTFGHLGFTGIAAWADPEHQLIYIFLSNRTYPTMSNKKLIIGDYRPRIQSIAYHAIQQLES